jgi:predicted nucleic acid-binding protein
LTTYFPDINVWVALSAERHVFCLAAESWLSSIQDEKLSFCRITQMGFLRLLTNPHVMKDEVMNPDEAWQAYRLLRSDERISYAAEPKGLSEE